MADPSGGGAGGAGPSQVVVILALPRGMTVENFAADFELHIPRLTGGSGPSELDEHFFSSMARFRAMRGEKPPILVSLYDGGMPKQVSGDVLYCIHGHGVHPRGQIINIGDEQHIDDKELEKRLKVLLATVGPGGRHQIFVDSCFADPPMLAAIERVKKECSDLEWEGETLGCSGVSVIHPNPGIPVVQFGKGYPTEALELQTALEMAHPNEVKAARVIVDTRLIANLPDRKDTEGRIARLWDVSKQVGKLQEPIFSKFIAVAHARGQLQMRCFSLQPGAWCAEARLSELEQGRAQELSRAQLSDVKDGYVDECIVQMLPRARPGAEPGSVVGGGGGGGGGDEAAARKSGRTSPSWVKQSGGAAAGAGSVATGKQKEKEDLSAIDSAAGGAKKSPAAPPPPAPA